MVVEVTVFWVKLAWMSMERKSPKNLWSVFENWGLDPKWQVFEVFRGKMMLSNQMRLPHFQIYPWTLYIYIYVYIHWSYHSRTWCVSKWWYYNVTTITHGNFNRDNDDRQKTWVQTNPFHKIPDPLYLLLYLYIYIYPWPMIPNFHFFPIDAKFVLSLAEDAKR